MSAPIVFVLKGYPRLSETFIAQEILALERRGLEIVIVSLRRPTDRLAHPINGEIKAPVIYLPEYLHQEPGRLWRAWRRARRAPGYKAARAVWWRDLGRDLSRNRVRRFGQALVLAAELPAGATRLHAHFLHTPASVARYAALLSALPWSCSAHAKDIWTSPDWEKAEKLASCEWLVTCTENGARHLRALAPPDTVELIYHGLDLERFAAAQAPGPERDGGDAADPVRILSVGRAVEKKGYDDLIDALAGLPATLRWHLDHIGGGPLLETLKRRAARAGIADRVTWLGAQSQDAVLGRYRAADLFVLASRVAGDGDRDGLPNVLLEAQSQALACITTSAGAASELIEDGVNGCLVAPGDPAALSRALAALAADPGRRRRLGEAGLAKVRARFDMAPGADRLAARFGLGAAKAPETVKTWVA